ncbi:MAG: CRISPR-associated helicase Cas3' [Thermincolia bacterium]
MDTLFHSLTAKPSLWSFQKETANHLLNGKNVILSAPTGAGKTWAALMSYLYTKDKGHPHVERVFYTLPLRTLATSLYQSTQADCQNAFTLVDNLWKIRSDKELAITIQTGEQQNDPFFQGDICFTTIDQLLSSYLNIPFSLHDRLANINAGALLGSLVVIDEIHLLEPDKSLWTVLEMVKRLKPYIQFLFMTATLSSAAISLIREHIDVEVVTVQSDELAQMPSHNNKQRTYRWMGEPLTAEKVIKCHNNGRSIVICNTVTKAQEIYEDLKKKAPADCRVILLHSRFYQEDRIQKERLLGDYFGPNPIKDNAILVATQVVEAGIDISAENLHTELCPANALLQRAGRCARYPQRNVGTVWVYELEKTASGVNKLGPYCERNNASAINLTREAMITRNGKMLDFQSEQKLVDEVHQETEQRIIRELFRNLLSCRKKVNDTIDEGGTSYARDLIRDVQSVNILFTSEPDAVELEKAPRLLSIPRTSLYILEKLLSANISGKWLAKIPVYNPDRIAENPYEWKELIKPSDITQISWLVAISPEMADYNPEIGFQLGIKGETPEVQYNDKPLIPNYSYDYEPYKDHIRQIVSQSRETSLYYSKASRYLEKNLNLPDGLVDWLIELSCAFHDAGKLTKNWYYPSQVWQKDNYRAEIKGSEGEPLAHCTYRPEKGDWLKQKSNKVYKRGPHALEGAFALVNSLAECIFDKVSDINRAELVTSAVVTAIGRHHTARASDIKDFQLIDGAIQWINQSLANCGIKESIIEVDNFSGDYDDKRCFQDILLKARNMEHESWIPLYWLLIRRLRLADQGSLKE